MQIEKLLRKIAKDVHSLNLFVAAKEIHGVYLFRNSDELTRLQEIYLSYLYFYYNLNSEVSLQKVSEIVLKDEVYEDAYSVWKQKDNKNTKDTKPTQRSSRAINLVFVDPNTKKV